MGLFETANFVCSVNILPAIPHFSGLGCPEVHSPRAGNSRICISGGEFVGRLGSHQGIDILSPVFCLDKKCATQRTDH